MKFDEIGADYGDLVEVTLVDGSTVHGVLSDIALDDGGSNDGDDEIDLTLEDGCPLNLMGVEVVKISKATVGA